MKSERIEVIIRNSELVNLRDMHGEVRRRLVEAGIPVVPGPHGVKVVTGTLEYSRPGHDTSLYTWTAP